MTKFNKSLLTAAVVGALALPSVASAAKLAYTTGTQITFAKDLIVNDNTTIYTPHEFRLAAEGTDLANIQTVNATAPASREVRFKVTLTHGAKFDSTASARDVVLGTLTGKPFLLGTQLAPATNTPITGAMLVGTPYYSASGQELNFTVLAQANGSVPGVAGEYAIQLNSLQVTGLVAGLYDASALSAEITAQNNVGQQILAARAVIARSADGLEYDDLASAFNANTKIDVVGGGSGASAYNRKTRFSPTGAVGGAATAAGTLARVWSPGGVVISVAEALKIGATTTSGQDFVNNYSAIAANPFFNVVSTSKITVEVKGTNLTAFANSTGAGGATVKNSWLSTNSNCSSPDVTGNNVVVNGDTISYSIAGNSGLVTNTIGAAVPQPLNLYVCLQANGAREMVAQQLSGSVSVDYDLPTQRRNPPAGSFALKPLVQNGTEVVFQNVNPAGNATAQSFLRLTNNNAFACPVVIDAKDDAGKHAGDINLTLAAHQSKQLNSEVLEGNATAAGVTGKFGDGTGKWYVRVLAECDNFVASALNRHQDGVVTDLTPQRGETWLTPDQKL